MKTWILFISGAEIFIVLIVVLLLFGSKKIPELAKGLGKGMKEFKRATEDIKRELHESTAEIRQSADEIRKDIYEVKDDLEKEASDIYNTTDEIRKDLDKAKEMPGETPDIQEPADKLSEYPADVEDKPEDNKDLPESKVEFRLDLERLRENTNDNRDAMEEIKEKDSPEISEKAGEIPKNKPKVKKKPGKA